MESWGVTRNAKTFAINPDSGLIEGHPALRRTLSYMRNMFFDQEAVEKMLAVDDVKLYDFFDLGLPAAAADLAIGTSIVYPGKVGDEYFMTKGHFHEVLDAAEAYHCLAGRGCMLMENPEGEWEAAELLPGRVVYVPGRYAHRSVNFSPDQPLVTFFAFRGDAGHDYASIEKQGFRKMAVERNGKPEFVDNPRWRGRK